MSTEFKREERYIVFKASDIERYLTAADRSYLEIMKNEIDAGRDCANRPPFKGLIVESDWPEYEPTWRAIEARVTGAQAQPAPSVPMDVIADYLVSISAHIAHQDDAKAQAEIGELLKMLAAAPKPALSVPDGWQLVPTAESRHPGIYKMLGALHAADNTPGVSEWESYRAMLSEAPEVKP